METETKVKYFSTPTDEQETTISYGRNDKKAKIWTNDLTMYTKLDRLCKEHPENWECFDIAYTRETHQLMYKRYQCDKKMISYRGGKIVFSEERRQELVNRFKEQS